MLTSSEISKRNKLQQEKPLVYNKIKEFEAKAARGESIAQIQLQYDYKCNMGCEHCCITGLRQNKATRCFTIDDVKELSRQADEMGLASVTITGGEPLLFPDFDQIVEALNPNKFYITSDSNGWLLDTDKAAHLKLIGIDRIQLSLDSLDYTLHDNFRLKPGAHDRAIKAIAACEDAGLLVTLATVVTHERLHSSEFIEFLEWAASIDVPVFVTYAKPVGAWSGHTDVMINRADLEFMKMLEQQYNVCTHLTPSYGNVGGCIAVKRIFSITKYGDVMPCPYMHTSLGNFFKEPLKDIVARGMQIPCFSKSHIDTCYLAEDREFIQKLNDRMAGKQLPIPYKEFFDA